MELRESDTFCPGCGHKIVREPEVQICRNCGAVLRPGAVFCHKCGEEVAVVRQKQKPAVTEPVEEPRRKRKPVWAEENEDKDYENDGEGYETEDDEYEYADDEEEDDDEGYEEEGSSFTKIIAILLGCVILVVAVVVGVMFWKNNKAGGSAATSTAQAAASAQSTSVQAAKESSANQVPVASVSGKLTITSNVNIRDQASKTSNILGVAKAGESYDYTDVIDSSWYKIKTSDGKDGYIFKDYVKTK